MGYYKSMYVCRGPWAKLGHLGGMDYDGVWAHAVIRVNCTALEVLRLAHYAILHLSLPNRTSSRLWTDGPTPSTTLCTVLQVVLCTSPPPDLEPNLSQTSLSPPDSALSEPGLYGCRSRGTAPGTRRRELRNRAIRNVCGFHLSRMLGHIRPQQ